MSNWKKELDKEFYLWRQSVRKGEFVTCGEEVKDFIEKTIKQERAKVREANKDYKAFAKDHYESFNEWFYETHIKPKQK